MLKSHNEGLQHLEIPPTAPSKYCEGWGERLAKAVVRDAIRDYYLNYKSMMNHLDQANLAKDKKEKDKEMAAVERHLRHHKKIRSFFKSAWGESLMGGETNGKQLLEKLDRATELKLAELDNARKKREEKGIRKVSKKKPIRCAVCGQYFVPFSLTEWELRNVDSAKDTCQECLDAITAEKMGDDIDLSDYEQEVDEW